MDDNFRQINAEENRSQPVAETGLIPGENHFYQEVVAPSPKKRGRWMLALVLAGGIILGTALGYGINQHTLAQVTGTEIAYATDQTVAANLPAINTISPVIAIVKKVAPAIVAIKIKAQGVNVFGDTVQQQGTGSGIIIDSAGHIVTNNHVVEGATSLTVLLKDGSELPATLVGRDPQTDLAVVQVDKRGLTYAELGDSSTLQVGEIAVAIGSPMGTDYAGSVTAGIISGLNRKVPLGDQTMSLIQTDAAINPGNSGGALVNGVGQVIGINSVKLIQSNVEGMGFAIPINEAKPIIQQLIQNKQIVRPYLGIQGMTVSKSDAEKYNLSQGVYVQATIAGSGAEKAGILSGEVITQIDEQKVLTIEALMTEVQKHKVNDVVKVQVVNKYQVTRTVSVKLTAVDPTK